MLHKFQCRYCEAAFSRHYHYCVKPYNIKGIVVCVINSNNSSSSIQNCCLSFLDSVSLTTSTDNTNLIRVRVHKAKKSPCHFMEMFMVQLEKVPESVWVNGLTALGAGMVGLHSSSATAGVSNSPWVQVISHSFGQFL